MITNVYYYLSTDTLQTHKKNIIYNTFNTIRTFKQSLCPGSWPEKKTLFPLVFLGFLRKEKKIDKFLPLEVASNSFLCNIAPPTRKRQISFK